MYGAVKYAYKRTTSLHAAEMAATKDTDCVSPSLPWIPATKLKPKAAKLCYTHTIGWNVSYPVGG